MASQGRPLRESRSGRKDMTGWEGKDWRAGDSFSWSKGLEADAGINVMCSGDRNRSNVAESRSGGDTGPGRRLGYKAGIMDLRQYYQFSLGTQVNVLLTLRPHSRNEGMCRPAPMKAPSPPSPPQHQASPPPAPSPLEFLLHFAPFITRFSVLFPLSRLLLVRLASGDGAPTPG